MRKSLSLIEFLIVFFLWKLIIQYDYDQLIVVESYFVLYTLSCSKVKFVVLEGDYPSFSCIWFKFSAFLLCLCNIHNDIRLDYDMVDVIDAWSIIIILLFISFLLKILFTWLRSILFIQNKKLKDERHSCWVLIFCLICFFSNDFRLSFQENCSL
jgi:hypothetical protein